MCNRARMDGEPETLWNSAAELFTERPRDNRFDPRELRPAVATTSCANRTALEPGT
jgi:hypothetical protein